MQRHSKCRSILEGLDTDLKDANATGVMIRNKKLKRNLFFIHRLERKSHDGKPKLGKKSKEIQNTTAVNGFK